jgi:hypothetical protein
VRHGLRAVFSIAFEELKMGKQPIRICAGAAVIVLPMPRQNWLTVAISEFFKTM